MAQAGGAWGELKSGIRLPEVRVRQDDEGFLEVSSPFMGLSVAGIVWVTKFGLSQIAHSNCSVAVITS